MITFKEYLAEIAIKGKVVKARDDEDDILLIASTILREGEQSYLEHIYEDYYLYIDGDEIQKDYDFCTTYISYDGQTIVEFESNEAFDEVRSVKIEDQVAYNKMIEFFIKDGVLE